VNPFGYLGVGDHFVLIYEHNGMLPSNSLYF